MSDSLQRFLYRCLLRLHPPSFQREFKDEMLLLFDELSGERGGLSLFGDALTSLTRQWVVRSFLQKLVIGEIGLSPAQTLASELFTWDRIGLPERRLPVPRIVQGSVASFAFIVSLSLLALGTGNAAEFHGVLRGGRDPACGYGQDRGSSPTRAFSSISTNGRTKLDKSSAAPALPPQEQAAPRDLDSQQRQDSASYRVSVITKGRDFLPVLTHTPPNPEKPRVMLEADSPNPPPPPDAPAAPVRLLTSQYDNMRTGANLNEKILTPTNVNAKQFGKLFTLPVDGDVYAQPLYLPDVEIPGKGKHNVLYVATENDSVYAFDADGTTTEPLWKVSLANDSEDIRPLTEADTQCFFIAPQIGITSTPVIDLPSGTMYVLARTKQSKGVFGTDRYKQRLHALAITTGTEKFGGPVEITATVPGPGRQTVQFNPQKENPRAALLLANGAVYLTWASSCDEAPYYGWVMAYDPQTLAQKGVFNTAPDTEFGGIWQGDAGPAADKNGNVFVVTGNGKFDGITGGRNFGDTVLKLGPDPQNLAPVDYFTPSNQEKLNERDNDLGSSGAVLLPDQPGAHPHLLVTAGKEGKIYLIDRDHMGKFQPGDDPHAVQTINASHGAFGAMAYWNRNVYFIGSEARLEDFAVEGGQLNLKAAGNTKFLDSGATPAVSANGMRDGIVWATSSKNWNEPPGRAAVLYAYDASDVHRELYTSEQNGARDRAGVALRFVVPSVINGKVYVGTKSEVDVYGLLPPH
jgi:hypothetical protein